jgi:hypothetical protein
MQGQRLLLRFCLAFAIFGFLVSLPFSRLLWKYLPGFVLLQFPWRLQPLVALCGVLLAACLIACREQFKSGTRKLLMLGLGVLLLSNFAFTYVIAKGPSRKLITQNYFRILSSQWLRQ